MIRFLLLACGNPMLKRDATRCMSWDALRYSLSTGRKTGFAKRESSPAASPSGERRGCLAGRRATASADRSRRHKNRQTPNQATRTNGCRAYAILTGNRLVNRLAELLL